MIKRKVMALVIIVLLILPMISCTQNQVSHPNWTARTWKLRADDITTIMGYRAELSGNLTNVQNPDAGPIKDVAVYGFASDKDALTWTVEVPAEAEYNVALLYHGLKDVLSGCSLEVSSGESLIEEDVQLPLWERKPFFQRHYLKEPLQLRAGVNRITLRLSSLSENQIETAKKSLEQGKSSSLVGNSLIDDGFCLWSIELVRPKAYEAIKKRADAIKSDASWMIDGKYGLFVTFTPVSYSFFGEKKNRDQYQELVDLFDVQAFADTVAETGASWVLLTTSHGGHYWPGPNKTIDQVLPGRTCERDLIRELIDALGKHNIRLMLYYHFGWNMVEDEDWAKASGQMDPDPASWFSIVESIFRETSIRYGEDLATTAAYVDDCGMIAYQYDPPWEAWARAIKAGNPNALVGFSQSYGPNVSPFSELQMTDGGYNKTSQYPAFMYEEKGQYEGLFPAVWFYMDQWLYGEPFNGSFYHEPKFSAEEYIEYFKKLDEADIPATIGIVVTGDVTSERPFFNPDCVEIWRKIRKAVKGNN